MNQEFTEISEAYSKALHFITTDGQSFLKHTKLNFDNYLATLDIFSMTGMKNKEPDQLTINMETINKKLSAYFKRLTAKIPTKQEKNHPIS